ncbi:MAG: arginine--tRNA ligase [Candidatus Aenigmarchaeota archaeon]|nr:arginine--tRNA ligase [Candidatus Aenigmarchaeota archaeon]MDW8149118.1 arginine--tRNA ligase [Candidatus Aenigmarchaeota archaeon]
MKIFEIINEIEKILNTNIKSFFKENENREFGDYSLTIAFTLSREKNKSLEIVAKEICEKLKQLEFLEKVEVKNGYVNLFLDYKKIYKEILSQKISFEKENKRILIEHTSVNPNKAIHIGHLRNSIIGDCLYRLLKNFYKTVLVSNYIDDTGQQIAEIILAFKELGFNIDTNKKFDLYCSEIYPLIDKKINEDIYLKNKLQEIIKSLEKYDEFNEAIILKVLKEQLETLKKFDIKFDFLIRERDILSFEIFKDAIKILEANNLLSKKDCIFVIFNNKEIPITRKDGTTLYVGKDIAFALWKLGAIKKDFSFEKFDSTLITSLKGNLKKIKSFDISINVIDVRQKDEQNLVKYIAEKITKNKYIHYSYEVVAISNETAKQLNIETEENILHLSGRKGIFINADDIVEKLKLRIKAINPKLSEKKVESLAINTIKYEFIKVSPEKMIIFDLEDSLKLVGNTAIYALYSFLRLKKILKKAEKIEKDFEVKEFDELEKELLFLILNYPLFLCSLKENLRINLLCSYLYRLSTVFNKFYEKNPVLTAEESVKNFRLNLLLSLKKVYESLFSIIGLKLISSI